jgi:hypothetical protein
MRWPRNSSPGAPSQVNLDRPTPRPAEKYRLEQDQTAIARRRREIVDWARCEEHLDLLLNNAERPFARCCSHDEKHRPRKVP